MSLDGFVQLIFNVYEAFTVALFVGDGDSLTCSSAVTFARSFDKTKALPIDGTLPGWAVKHKQPLIIGNFDKDEGTLGYYAKKEEIKSFMAYPLDIPGVIVVDSKKKWVFTEKEKKILAHFVAILTKEVEGEKRLQEMEEEREELLVTRRILGFLREPRPGVAAVEEILKEGLTISGADMAIAGIEKNGRLKIVASAGKDAEELLGAECPARTTIASTVVESAREFVLPYQSGYLREKPLLFQNDGVKARQYFGFPLMTDEKPYGFLGFVSLSSRQLREASISALRNMSGLLSLYLTRLKVKEEMRLRNNMDPPTGALRIGAFLNDLDQMVKKRKPFSLISVKLINFSVYNRSKGMEYGDSLLRKVYQGIQYCVGTHAIIARMGGGHFYIGLKGSDVLEGQNILKMLKLTIQTNLSSPEAAAKGVVQIGTAYFPRDGEALWGLLDIAKDRGKENIA